VGGVGGFGGAGQPAVIVGPPPPGIVQYRVPPFLEKIWWFPLMQMLMKASMLVSSIVVEVCGATVYV
jgi:hypothetical protein